MPIRGIGSDVSQRNPARTSQLGHRCSTGGAGGHRFDWHSRVSSHSPRRTDPGYWLSTKGLVIDEVAGMGGNETIRKRQAALRALPEKFGQALLVHNDDCTAIHLDQSFVPELSEGRAHGFSAASDQVRHFLMCELDVETGAGTSWHTVCLAKFQQEV